MIGRGNHATNFYVCANMNYDLGVYDEEFQANGIEPIMYGSMFFADFSHLKSPEIQGAIVEIHGLAPGFINVGIYIDDLGMLTDIRISMVFEHIGDRYFRRLSN